MAYSDKNIKRDNGGVAIPQLFDPTADDYAPLLGREGVMYQKDCIVVKNYYRQLSTLNVNYGEEMYSILVINDGAEEISIYLDDVLIAELKQDETFGSAVSAFTHLVINSSTGFRAWVGGIE